MLEDDDVTNNGRQCKYLSEMNISAV